MHVRISRVRRKGKLYEYAQLVESYRRPDGTPAHRVLKSLGSPDSPEVQNLRAALDAARKGKRLAVAKGSAPSARAPKPSANRRYLDIAVLHELWERWGLGAILDELIQIGEAELRPACVVEALSIQRCVDPGSKLAATRWLPTTVLVELLGIDVGSFNNTRLHRVLDRLDEVTPALMAKLPTLYQKRDGAFASLFLDVTDAWFVGRGCEMAERAKTKEKVVRRKIGIVLLCNEHGYPLRWEVVGGTQHDSRSMLGLIDAVAGLGWATQTPLVCDRAMGNTAHLQKLLTSGVHFLTAVTRNEYENYARELPCDALAQLEVASRDELLAQASELAVEAGLERVADNLFVLDMGVVEHSVSGKSDAIEADDETDVTVEAMRLCRQLGQMVAEGRFASYRAAGRELGLGASLVGKYRRLHTLSEQQQRDIIEGKLAGHPLSTLLSVAMLESAEERQQAFDALLHAPRPRRRARRRRSNGRPKAEPEQTLRVRVVGYFNPEMFVEQRLVAQQKLERFETFVAQLNDKLLSPRSTHTRASVAAQLDRRLHKDALLDAFEVDIHEETTEPGRRRARLRVDVRLKRAVWARRRRFDGFNVLVAHPDLPQPPAQLCQLYRAKDAVEKDFQVIKSVTELRPVWHQTDAKVRAHVTICMLALLLERTLRRQLRRSRFSSERALEILRTCHLNEYAAPGDHPSAYTITRPDEKQMTLLRTLRMQELADDDVLAARISPR